MSRKFIISEDERARILGLHETAKSNHGTVISEQSMGVGFMSGEPNGLKIKKEEPTEQITKGVPQKTAGDIGVASKPTYENNGAKYYVPNLDSNTYNKFVEFNQFADIPSKLANLKKLNVSANLDPSYNALAVPQETFDKQWETFSQRIAQGQSPLEAFKDLGILSSVNFIENTLSSALNSYLRSWRPDLKGMSILSDVNFTQKPAVVKAKKYIKNFDEVFPKVLQSQMANSGLKLA
jgi:hypothetical protein